MRKIMIGTPIKTGIDSNYMQGLVPTLQQSIEGIELEHVLMEGPSVNFARNSIVHEARKRSFGEVVFIDDDMGWNFDYFKRIVSHVGVPVVAGLYCKRRPGKPHWLMNPKPGAEIDKKTGLVEVHDIATGFMKIDLDLVCPKLEERYPWLRFYNTPEKQDPSDTAWEFFPMGVEGPSSPLSQVEQIREIMKGYNPNHETDALRMIEEVAAVLNADIEPGTLRGEDYMFCWMVRQCGLKVYADFGLPPIPHNGLVPFPITPEMVGLDPAGALKKPNHLTK
jgi:hypothetical protein